MDTEVRQPVQLPPSTRQTGSARRGHRWVIWLVGLVLFVLLVAATAGRIWIARYQPLASDTSGFGLQGPSSLPGVTWKAQEVKWIDVPGGATIYSAVVPSGSTFTYAFNIENNGRVAMTITSIGSPYEDDRGMLVRRKAIAYLPDVQDARTTAKGWLPFEPFTLEPGANVGIRMQATLTHCIDVHSGVYFADETVTYKVFGFTRSTMLESNVQIDLLGQPGCR